MRVTALPPPSPKHREYRLAGSASLGLPFSTNSILRGKLLNPSEAQCLDSSDAGFQQFVLRGKKEKQGWVLHIKGLRFTYGGNERIEMEEQGQREERQELTQTATGLLEGSIQVSWGFWAIVKIRGMGKDNFKSLPEAMNWHFCWEMLW